MKEQAIVKQFEGMTPSQRAAAEAAARRAGQHAVALTKEKYPHLADNSVNVAEKVGGGVVGWGVELGVRALVDKLGQPAADGTVNTFGKNKDLWKGGISMAISAATITANVAMTGSTESSIGRRLATTAGVVTGAFGFDRIAKAYLKLPS